MLFVYKNIILYVYNKIILSVQKSVQTRNINSYMQKNNISSIHENNICCVQKNCNKFGVVTVGDVANIYKLLKSFIVSKYNQLPSQK